MGPGRSSEPKLYSDLRILGCVRIILAGEQWDDPNAKKYVERYTGRWSRVENILIPSTTIDGLIEAIKGYEKAKERLDKRINKFTTEFNFKRFKIKQ